MLEDELTEVLRSAEAGLIGNGSTYSFRATFCDRCARRTTGSRSTEAPISSQLVTPLDPERTLSALERLLVGIFQAEGPVLGFTRAVRLAEAAGMNPASAGVYLSRSPVFQTVSRGRYAIRGYSGEVLSPRAAVRNELAREALVA